MVQGPMEPALKSQLSQNLAVIDISINVANFLTTERKKRLKNEKRIIELKTTLERTFQKSVMCHLYPRTLIQVNVHVLALDGGLLAGITNSITLALIDAGVAMYDYVAAVGAGLHNSAPLLDLNTLEENDMSSLTVGVIGKSEKLALLILEDRMPMDRWESVLAIGIAGGHRIRDLMDEEVRRHGNERLTKLSEKS